MSFNGGASDQGSDHNSGFSLTPNYSALTPSQFGFGSLNDSLMNAGSNEPEGVVNELQFNTIPFEDDHKADISKPDLKQQGSTSRDGQRGGGPLASRPGPGTGDASLHGSKFSVDPKALYGLQETDGLPALV